MVRMTSPEKGTAWSRLTALPLCIALVALFALLIGLAPGVTPAVAAATTYTVTDLGVLSGDETSYASDINISGQVTGVSTGPGGHRAFRWENGTMTGLGVPTNDDFVVTGMNSNGDIVGWTASGFNGSGFVIRGTTVTNLQPLLGGRSSQANGINDSGIIAGVVRSIDGSSRAILTDGQTVTNLDHLPGATISTAVAINYADQSVGTSNGPVRWQWTAATPLPQLPGKTITRAEVINDVGQIAGVAYNTLTEGNARIVLWENGAITDLGNLGTGAQAITVSANDINVYGQIVGSSSRLPFLYSDGTMTDVNTLLSPGSGWEITGVSAINDLGMIVGSGKLNGGPSRAILLTPAEPNPSPSPLPSPSPRPSPSPVTVTLEQSAGGTATVTPAGPYTVGQQIEARATADTGMLFIGWQGTGFANETGAGPIGAQGASVSASATGAQIGAWGNPLQATITNTNVTLKPIFVAIPSFGDVPTSNPAYSAITELAARGVINGCDSSATPPLFCPADPTLRHQMAALIVRAMPGWADETGLPTFTDNTDDTELMTRVATVQRHNVARGYQDEVCTSQGKTPPCYGPLDTVKYGQTLLFIARAMVEKGYWELQPDDRTIFPDQNGPTGADPNTDQQTKDHRMIVTYIHYAGAPPDVANVNAPFQVTGASAGGWGDDANRGWFARALWQALNEYFGE